MPPKTRSRPMPARRLSAPPPPARSRTPYRSRFLPPPSLDVDRAIGCARGSAVARPIQPRCCRCTIGAQRGIEILRRRSRHVLPHPSPRESSASATSVERTWGAKRL
jgi:hypothetical protein